MNNLTTRKIVLGLLITLVLAFSVPGVVEAVEDPDIQSDALNPNAVQNVGGTVTITIQLTPDKTDTRETVSISKSSGIDFTGANFFGLSSISLREDEDLADDPPADGTNFTYRTSRGVDREIGVGSIPIPIRFNNKGRQTVTISSRDYEGDDAGSWSYRYTYYVMGPGTSSTTVSLRGLSNGYRTGIVTGDGHQIVVHDGDSGHYQVTYSTVPTGGAFQIEQPDASLTAGTGVGSSAFDVLLTMSETSETRQVTAKVTGSDPGVETVGVYIIGTPTLAVGSPGDTNRDGVVEASEAPGNKEMGGRINQVLSKAFSAVVTDGAGNLVPGVVVRFQASGSGNAGGYLVFKENTGSDIDAGTRGTDDSAGNNGFLVSSSNRRILNANGQRITRATDKVIYVRTNIAGLADVDFQLGTDRKQDVTVSAVRQTKTVSAYAGESVSGNQLVEPSSVVSRALGRAGEYELRVTAEDEDGEALPQRHVEFRTSDGTLEDPSTVAPATDGGRLPVRTDTQGVAFIFFDPKDSSGSPRVTAHLLDTAIGGETAPALNDKVIDDVVFNIRGGTSRQQQQQQQQQQTTGSLNITVRGTGTTRSVTVNAVSAAGTPTAIPAVLTGTATSTQTIITGTATEITLPTAPGSYTLTATASVAGYNPDTETITVAGPSTRYPVDYGQSVPRMPGSQTFSISAVDADGDRAIGDFTARLSGTGFTSRDVEIARGRGNARVTLPTAGGLHTLTVRATGYTDGSTTVRIAGTGQQQQQQQPAQQQPAQQQPTVSEPDSVSIVGPSQRDGTANTVLDAALIVEVVDDDGDAVADARVIFRVRTGQGRLSERGNGRAIAVQTNSSGYARATYTPISASSTVEAGSQRRYKEGHVHDYDGCSTCYRYNRHGGFI